MQTNIKKLRISKNAFEIPVEPELGDELIFQGKGIISNKIQTSNEDGTANVVYELKPTLIEAKRSSTSGPPLNIIKNIVKDKSRSKNYRDKLYVLWSNKGSVGTFEGFYNAHYEELEKQLDTKIDEEIMGSVKNLPWNSL